MLKKDTHAYAYIISDYGRQYHTYGRWSKETIAQRIKNDCLAKLKIIMKNRIKMEKTLLNYIYNL